MTIGTREEFRANVRTELSLQRKRDLNPTNPELVNAVFGSSLTRELIADFAYEGALADINAHDAELRVDAAEKLGRVGSPPTPTPPTGGYEEGPKTGSNLPQPGHSINDDRDTYRRMLTGILDKFVFNITGEKRGLLQHTRDDLYAVIAIYEARAVGYSRRVNVLQSVVSILSREIDCGNITKSTLIGDLSTDALAEVKDRVADWGIES